MAKANDDDDNDEKSTPAGRSIKSHSSANQENKEEEEVKKEPAKVDKEEDTEDTHTTNGKRFGVVNAEDNKEVDNKDIPLANPGKLIQMTSKAITIADKEAESPTFQLCQ